MSNIRIIWNDEGADEDHDTKHIDLIPFELLEGDGVRDNVSHQVIGPRGGLTIARCAVSAEGRFVYINYEPYYKKDSKEYIPGVLRLEFSGERRSGLPKVSWRNRGESDFKSDVASAEFDGSARIESSEIDEFDDADQFDPSGVKDERDRVIVAIKRRRGQPKFRNELADVLRNPNAVMPPTGLVLSELRQDEQTAWRVSSELAEFAVCVPAIEPSLDD